MPIAANCTFATGPQLPSRDREIRKEGVGATGVRDRRGRAGSAPDAVSVDGSRVRSVAMCLLLLPRSGRDDEQPAVSKLRVDVRPGRWFVLHNRGEHAPCRFNQRVGDELIADARPVPM